MSGMIGADEAATMPVGDVEPCNGISRLVALIAMTVAYVLCWSQAEPNPDLLAQRQQIEPNQCLWPALPLPAKAAAATQLVFAAVRSGELQAPAIEVCPVAGGMELEQLLLHVGQLPLGLPAGEYRIFEGTRDQGILRVTTGTEIPLIALHNCWTSTHAGVTLEFRQLAHLATREMERLSR